jgi:hypothetical protein
MSALSHSGLTRREAKKDLAAILFHRVKLPDVST